jgi:hypothetical protein
MGKQATPRQIDGLPGWWQEVPQRYVYASDPLHCPVCGGVGWVWRGCYTCDGSCGAVAVVATGQVFVPVPTPSDATSEETKC